jgi:hypothetical protein
MGEAIQLGNATLVAGPLTTSTDSPFPSGIGTVPLSLTPQQKPYAVSTGPQLANVNSPSAPVALNGVGSGQAVTQCHTLYLRTASPMVLSLTPNGGTAQTIKIYGLVVLEFDPANPVTAVSIQGSGQVEYLCVGNL